MKRIKNKFSRRGFMKTGAFVAAAGAGASLMVGENPELVSSAEAQGTEDNRTTALAQCPYCGVGCGTIIQGFAKRCIQALRLGSIS